MNLLGKSACCALVALGVSVSTSAQDMRSASKKVVACQDVSDPAERLACFEVAAAELSVILAAPVQEVAVSPDSQAPSMPTAPTEQQAAVTAAPTSPAANPESAATDAAVQQASTEAATEREAPRSRLPSWIPRVTFGSNRDVEKEPDEFETQLTRIQVNRIGRHFFTTEEGHVWRQKTPEEIRAPKTLPADVILYQNITGGLRLKIVESNRSYAVQRVE